MPSLTTNSANRGTNSHRAQIVAEAVVSAYVQEISTTQRRRERRRTSHRRTQSFPRAIICSSPAPARALGHGRPGAGPRWSSRRYTASQVSSKMRTTRRPEAEVP